MNIVVTSVLVDDQDKALRFYTDVLGFEKKQDVPLADRRLAAGSGRYRAAPRTGRSSGSQAVQEGAGRGRHPVHLVGVDDIKADFERLSGRGVRFTQPPTEMGPVTTAVFDDTCGNLIQIAQRA